MIRLAVSSRAPTARGYFCSKNLRSSAFPVGRIQKRSFFSSSKKQQQQRSAASAPRRDPGLEFTAVVSNPQEVDGPEGIVSRSEQIKKLQSQSSNKDDDIYYDVLIIGGGATGAGAALDAAARGYKVACIERGDFASETSSRSTKLIWAGIKYMGTAFAALLSPNLVTAPLVTLSAFYGEMKMVYQCHQERRYMMQKQEHLCQWIPILIPFDRWYVSPPPFNHSLYGFFPILAPFVLKVYDALSWFQCPPSYTLSPSRAAEKFPQLQTDNLKYCAVFYEAIHNDARTNLAIAMTAAQRGAHIANYVEMVDTIVVDQEEGGDKNKVVGVVALDRMTDQRFEIRAKKIIFCGGPFTDNMRQLEHDSSSDRDKKLPPAVTGAHGTHIVLPSYYCPPDIGFLDYNTSDKRFLFLLPWQGHTIVGTTDHKCSAETLPRPPEEEVEWILKESSKYMKIDYRREDVSSSWRGWRPLAVDPNAQAGDDVSRDHVISENSKTGVFFIAGGKWTTWREMAQEVVDKALGTDRPCPTLDIQLFGGEGYSNTLSVKLIQKYGISQSTAEHLSKTYGGRAWEVLQLDGRDKLLKEGYPYIESEVRYACCEYACTVEDILSRRTRLAFVNKEAALQCISRVTDIMAEELKWSSRVKKQQMQAATAYIGSYGGSVPQSAANEGKADVAENEKAAA
mmetsp:Transcript_11296/g.18694  ORF Transcript_11296/g.18694 Transcript_11296/m.18694 type:complete len:680 (-) Transcript_11296:543-2582(-)